MLIDTRHNDFLVLSIIAAAYGSSIFHAVFSLLGTAHQSTIYRAFSVTAAALVLLAFASRLLSGLRMTKTSLACISVWYLVLLSFFICGYGRPVATGEFVYFCVWGLSPLAAGFMVSSPTLLDRVIRYSDVVWPTLALGALLYIVRGQMGAWVAIDDSGASYQSASYSAALAYGLDMYGLLFWEKNQELKFWWARTRHFRFLSLVSIPVLLSLSFFSGGRGGLVAVFLLTILGVISLQTVRKSPLLFLLTAVAALMIAMRLYDIATMNSTSLGIWRLTRESGREEVYRQSLNLISERPLFGYGFFGYIDALGAYRYPHNLLLQALLSCGVMGTIILSILLFSILFHLGLMEEQQRYFVIVQLVVILTHLTFSGSFIYDTEFLFCIGLMSNFSNKYVLALER